MAKTRVSKNLLFQNVAGKAGTVGHVCLKNCEMGLLRQCF